MADSAIRWREVANILRNVNLNLLPILQLLLKTRSVSATAVALGISQPAVSDALARLRVMLEDQLLVRVGSRMNLTAYAERLIEPLDKICANLQDFLTKENFDPKTAQRQFVVATSDLGAHFLARPILDMLIVEAPNINLQFIDVAHDLTTRLATREIDIALLPEFSIEDLAPAPLRFQAVVDMPRVVLMRKGHPLSSQSVISDVDVARYKHITFQPDPILKTTNRLPMLTNGVQVEFVARLNHALLLPHLLIDTDFVSIVPKRFADEIMKTFSVESRSMANAGPLIEFGFAWSAVQDHDPAHSWFRSAIARSFALKFGPRDR